MTKVERCEFCHEKVDPENDRFVVLEEACEAKPRKVAHTECHQRHTES